MQRGAGALRSAADEEEGRHPAGRAENGVEDTRNRAAVQTRVTGGDHRRGPLTGVKAMGIVGGRFQSTLTRTRFSAGRILGSLAEAVHRPKVLQ